MKSKKFPKQKGTTLIELMIVVVIITILAIMAIPRFMKTTVKTKQSEAKSILKQIYTAESSYRQEKDCYYPGDGSTVVAQPGGFFIHLGVEIMPSAYYSYSITGDSYNFIATAGSKSSSGLDDDPFSDIWTINQTGTLICLSDDSQN